MSSDESADLFPVSTQLTRRKLFDSGDESPGMPPSLTCAQRQSDETESHASTQAQPAKQKQFQAAYVSTHRKCPLCDKMVRRKKQHLLRYHKLSDREARKVVKDFEGYGENTKSGNPDIKSRRKKCPVTGCYSQVIRMRKHLTKVHGFTNLKIKKLIAEMRLKKKLKESEVRRKQLNTADSDESECLRLCLSDSDESGSPSEASAPASSKRKQVGTKLSPSRSKTGRKHSVSGSTKQKRTKVQSSESSEAEPATTKSKRKQVRHKPSESQTGIKHLVSRSSSNSDSESKHTSKGKTILKGTAKIRAVTRAIEERGLGRSRKSAHKFDPLSVARERDSAYDVKKHIKNFVIHLKSRHGSARKGANEYGAAMKRFMKTFKAFKDITVKSIFEKYLPMITSRKGLRGTVTFKTITNNLTYLKYFIDFLLNAIDPVVLSQETKDNLQKVLLILPKWINSYRSDKVRQSNAYRDFEEENLITKEHVTTFRRSAYAQGCRKKLLKIRKYGLVKELKEPEYDMLRNYLLVVISANNAFRAGLIRNFKLDEYKNGKRARLGRKATFFVSKHKTADTTKHGSARLTLNQEQSYLLDAYLILRARVPTDSKHVFIKCDGSRISSSNLPKYLTRAFTLGGVKGLKATNTRFRKLAVTIVHETRPEEKENLASHMAHDVKTAEKYYKHEQKKVISERVTDLLEEALLTTPKKGSGSSQSTSKSMPPAGQSLEESSIDWIELKSTKKSEQYKATASADVEPSSTESAEESSSDDQNIMRFQKTERIIWNKEATTVLKDIFKDFVKKKCFTLSLINKRLEERHQEKNRLCFLLGVSDKQLLAKVREMLRVLSK
jgi:hypothetical protein